jgi:peptide/nickel transport system substrate-binding protein
VVKARRRRRRGVTAINMSYGAGDPFSGFMRIIKADMAPPAGGNWGNPDDPVLEPMRSWRASTPAW